MPRILFPFVVLALLFTACSENPSDETAPIVLAHGESAVTSDEFGDYWYQGEAELTSYRLEQARYGEIHDGEAVLIFVTEDFSREKHVKLDNPGEAGADKVNILKLNLTKKFNTGIYPYSMMSSVFTPVQGADYPRTLKVTTTSQEWCGHTFTQIDLRRNKYHLDMRSYFESEGDQQVTLDDVMLEDEIWTALRLDPDRLPAGEIRLIPGTMYQRLSHGPWKVERARATMEASDGLNVYTIAYEELGRTLKIRFNPAFPHEIEGWEETYQSGMGPDATVLTTRAVRDKRMMLDYWNRHSNADEPLRQELGLD